jgi:hypothetical protein
MSLAVDYIKCFVHETDTLTLCMLSKVKVFMNVAHTPRACIHAFSSRRMFMYTYVRAEIHALQTAHVHRHMACVCVCVHVHPHNNHDLFSPSSAEIGGNSVAQELPWVELQFARLCADNRIALGYALGTLVNLSLDARPNVQATFFRRIRKSRSKRHTSMPRTMVVWEGSVWLGKVIPRLLLGSEDVGVQEVQDLKLGILRLLRNVGCYIVRCLGVEIV